MTASLLPLAAETPAKVRDACGTDPSLLCRETFNLTHNGSVARIVEFVSAIPTTESGKLHRRQMAAEALAPKLARTLDAQRA